MIENKSRAGFGAIKRVATVILALAAAAPVGAGERQYSRAAELDVPRQLFWGDTHLHTRLSMDSYTMGKQTPGPETAYRFARGEKITAPNGMEVKLRRPLDFLVVTDHAEYLGLIAGLADGNPAILDWETELSADGAVGAGGLAKKVVAAFAAVIGGEPQLPVPPGIAGSIWQSVGESADRFNEPGRFTAFIGYEYTSMPNMANLHRNVIFRDGADLTSRQLPFSGVDSRNPEDLWNYLEDYERRTGGAALAIPHNGNLSSGRMFETKRYEGGALTADYAKARSRWEPLYEMTQIKGDAETHPILSPEDEFADYETWNSWFGPSEEGVKTEGWEQRKASEYARSALKLGLAMADSIGVNPFKFGLIGSTDSHTALATAAEDNFWGKNITTGFPAADRWSSPFAPKEFAAEMEGGDDVSQMSATWTSAASGLAAVWARENTREAVFDAMRRREVYATTGSRIAVRFFGGWDYPQDADLRPDYVDIGYTGGVPMGGDLTGAPAGKAPVFLVVAAKDPDEANLDRVQIVKGWLESNGSLGETVYDVAWSGEREPDSATGRLPPVGSTVDLAAASYTNAIGEALLSATWTDPDFDPAERAFYYARVLEIPKPRWTAYDAAFFKTKLPDYVPMITQDRAYTSPIWYSP